MPATPLSRAIAAGPESPPKPATPVPAIVVMIDVARRMTRTTAEAASTTYTFSHASVATDGADLKSAAAASPPSPA
jgi:hypothetical protein